MVFLTFFIEFIFEDYLPFLPELFILFVFVCECILYAHVCAP